MEVCSKVEDGKVKGEIKGKKEVEVVVLGGGIYVDRKY